VIAGLVLAGGAGRRFGGPKQLAPFRGRPLLQHAVDAQLAVPALERVVVVLGARADEVRAAVAFGRAEPVVADDWAEGQAASLRRGLAALAAGDPEAVLVTLGDQPLIAAPALAAVLDAGLAAGEPATRATYAGRPGHPVLLRRPLLGRLRALRGDAGARDLLREVPVRLVEAGDLADPTDVDTPEQLRALAAPG
jgi:CTP:molybdopterin cytidylyltransferase MocA